MDRRPRGLPGRALPDEPRLQPSADTLAETANQKDTDD